MLTVILPARRVAIVALSLATMTACSESPAEVVFQVIEDTQFAASLNIDLSAMQQRANGVYWQDEVVGTGDEVVFGTTPTVTFTGWLSDGTQFDSGTFFFLMGNNEVVPGFEDGLLNQRVGGTRLVIIPPNRGYGGLPQFNSQTGEVSIPAGSILVFRLTVDEVN